MNQVRRILVEFHLVQPSRDARKCEETMQLRRSRKFSASITRLSKTLLRPSQAAVHPLALATTCHVSVIGEMDAWVLALMGKEGRRTYSAILDETIA